MLIRSISSSAVWMALGGLNNSFYVFTWVSYWWLREGWAG
jgi:hypothetical protein